jgi:membrane protein YdbS with pleckstrin-like domain
MSLVLRPDEFVKIEVHFSYKVFVFPMLLMSIAILMFLAVISGAADGITVRWLGRIVDLTTILVGIGLCLLVPYIYKRLDNRLKIYAVTNQRVYIRRGIINIREKDIPLPKINDVQIFQTFVQRIFAAADVVIQVGNDESRICVEDINRPREFRDTILSAIYEMKKMEDMLKQNVAPDMPPPPQYPPQAPYPPQSQYQQPQYPPQQQYPSQNYGSNYGSSYQDDYNSDNNYHKPYDPDGF